MVKISKKCGKMWIFGHFHTFLRFKPRFACQIDSLFFYRSSKNILHQIGKMEKKYWPLDGVYLGKHAKTAIFGHF